MNKLITKIVGVALGLGLATGVAAGVVAGGKSISPAHASAATASWTVTSTNKLEGKTGTFLDSEGNTWSYESDQNAGNFQSTQGAQQIGANGSAATVSFSTSSITDTITSVSVECASYQAKHTVSITVGGTTYLAATATPQWTTVGTKSGTGSSTGEIVISFVPGASARAMYIKSITVVYEPSGSTPVTGVSLDKELAYTHVGTNLTLEATVAPNSADDKVVTWSSNNTSVATVSNGIVAPVSPGTARITVTTHDGGFTDYCDVTVFALNHGLVENDPLTIAEALIVAKSLAADAITTSEYYISGVVSSIKTAFSSTYNSISLNFESGDDTFIGFQLTTTEAYANSIEVGETVVLFKGHITNYKGNTYETTSGGSIITGTVYPEPSLINGTLAQLFANTDGNYKQRYQVTGIVSAWKDGESNGTKYGNFYLQAEGNTTDSYYIYGATTPSSALVWNENAGLYTFTNQQNFLTADLTKDVALGDTVTLVLTRCDQNETPRACGIVISVTHNVVSYAGQYVLTSEGSYTASSVTYNYKVEFNGVSSSLGAESSYTFSAKCLVVLTISDAANSGEYYISYDDNGTDQYLKMVTRNKLDVTTNPSDANTVWKLSASGNGFIATNATFQDSSKDVILQYNPNSGNGRFAGYSTAQKNAIFVPYDNVAKAGAFVENYMHVEIETSETGESTGYATCKGTGYYDVAKSHFNSLDSDVRAEFISNSKFANYYQRLLNWAVANNDQLGTNNGQTNVLFSKNTISGFAIVDDNTNVMTFVIIMIVLTTSTGAIFLLRKKKEER